MKIEHAIGLICRSLHLDMDLDHPNLDSLLDEIVQALSRHERIEVREALDAALAGKYTGAELKGPMNRSMRDTYFRKSKGVVQFLAQVRDKLASMD